MKSLLQYINESKNSIIYDKKGMPIAYKITEKLVVSFIDKHHRVDELSDNNTHTYKYDGISI